MDDLLAADLSHLRRGTGGQVSYAAPPKAEQRSVPIDPQTRRANVKLAIILALVAFGFYLLMLIVEPG